MNKAPGNSAPFSFKLYQPEPGHPDWTELHEEARALHREIAAVVKKDSELDISDRLSDWNRRRKSYATTVKTFFENRRRVRRGDHCVLPLYWIWVMHNACNLRCEYCDDHAGAGWFEKDDRETLDTAGGKRLMELMRTGCSSIYFCGGEPTIRKDLPEMVDHGWELGYFPMAMNSNVTVIHDKLRDAAWREVMRKLDILVISVDALDPALLDEMYGRPYGRRVLVNALMLRELQKTNKFMLIVNSVVTPKNAAEAKKVLDFCNDLGVFYAAVPANEWGGPDRALFENREYLDFVDTFLARKRAGYPIIGSHYLLKKFLHAEPYTCLTTMKPHVGPDGRVPWPCRGSVNVEPVWLSAFDYESVNELYEAGRKLVSVTDFHGPARNQCGGECAWYQNYTTEVYRETLLRPWRFVAESRELTSNL